MSQLEEYLVLRKPGQAERLRSGGGPKPWEHWAESDSAEALVHRIHPYPAKFPALVPTRALDMAAQRGHRVRRVADIFCGCGTVAIETRRRGLDFWGSDLNPVATLLARVKSSNFEPERIARLTANVISSYDQASESPNLSDQAAAQMLKWYTQAQFSQVAKLRNAIECTVGESDPYRDLFLCAFSAILKSASQWKARSTKPAFDITKSPSNVLNAFARQCRLFVAAWSEQKPFDGPRPEICVANATASRGPIGKVDLLITSPPYVTSYEYADIHQLSLLWLGFADDHRTVRAGMIGSSANSMSFASSLKELNTIGSHTAFSVYGRDPASVGAIARYYLDMQRVAKRSYELLTESGMAVFVIGNTECKGIRLENAAHLAESLLRSGFDRISVGQRIISNKKNTPYRSESGRLAAKPADLNVYSQEYILVAEK